MNKIKNGFTLIELLVVVLIIGILAAIALPQYQLATDKARYAKMMDFTKAIAEAELRASILKENPTFNDLDIDIPPSCNKVNSTTISCDNGTWGCLIINSENYWPRCTDLKLNATYFYSVGKNTTRIIRNCYAHTTNDNDRSNRLCKAMTNNKTNWSENINIFNGSKIYSNGYRF